MGYLIAVLFMGGYFGTVFAGLSLSDIKGHFQRLSKVNLIKILIITLVFLLIIMAIMAKENYIYYWDLGSYWYKTLSFSETLFTSPYEAMKGLVGSINSDEYNILACAIIALPLKIFSNTYYSFIIINLCIFYIPNALLTAFVLNKIIDKYNLSNVSYVFTYFFCITFTIILFPLLDGYVDIIGMLPLVTLHLLVIDRDFKGVDIFKDLISGMSLLWVILLRRYYAYAIIGGVIFTLFYWYIFPMRSRPFYLKVKIIDTLIILAIPVSTLLLIFNKFLKMSLFNNHFVAYSAYKTSTFMQQWGELFIYIGIFSTSFLILGILVNIRNQAVFLTLSFALELIITSTLFFRIQNMGAQHYYIVSFPICSLVFLGSIGFLNIFSKKKLYRCFAKIFVIGIIVGNFIISIGLGKSFKSMLWVNRAYHPKVRYDIDVLKGLQNHLIELEDKGYRKIYCLGSSEILCSDILAKLDAPNMALPFALLHDSHVDLRDGFSTNFFDADIVLACDPVQYHLSHGQEVILQLNKVMLEENQFSENYKLESSFTLDRNINVLVYTKQSPLTKNDIEYIGNIFEELYPDYPDLFTNRIDYYISQNY